MKTTLFVVTLFLSTLCFARTSGLKDKSQLSAPSFMTAGEYCEFLNAVAANDPHHLYDEIMCRDAKESSIVRLGRVGTYHYSIATGKAELPLGGLDFFSAMCYRRWKDQQNQDAENGIFDLNNKGGTSFTTTSFNSNQDQALRCNNSYFQLTTTAPLLSQSQSKEESSNLAAWGLLGFFIFEEEGRPVVSECDLHELTAERIAAFKETAEKTAIKWSLRKTEAIESKNVQQGLAEERAEEARSESRRWQEQAIKLFQALPEASLEVQKDLIDLADHYQRAAEEIHETGTVWKAKAEKKKYSPFLSPRDKSKARENLEDIKRWVSFSQEEKRRELQKKLFEVLIRNEEKNPFADADEAWGKLTAALKNKQQVESHVETTLARVKELETAAEPLTKEKSTLLKISQGARRVQNVLQYFSFFGFSPAAFAAAVAEITEVADEHRERNRARNSAQEQQQEVLETAQRELQEFQETLLGYEHDAAKAEAKALEGQRQRVIARKQIMPPALSDSEESWKAWREQLMFLAKERELSPEWMKRLECATAQRLWAVHVMKDFDQEYQERAQKTRQQLEQEKQERLSSLSHIIIQKKEELSKKQQAALQAKKGLENAKSALEEKTSVLAKISRNHSAALLSVQADVADHLEREARVREAQQQERSAALFVEEEAKQEYERAKQRALHAREELLVFMDHFLQSCDDYFDQSEILTRRLKRATLEAGVADSLEDHFPQEAPEAKEEASPEPVLPSYATLQRFSRTIKEATEIEAPLLFHEDAEEIGAERLGQDRPSSKVVQRSGNNREDQRRWKIREELDHLKATLRKAEAFRDQKQREIETSMEKRTESHSILQTMKRTLGIARKEEPPEQQRRLSTSSVTSHLSDFSVTSAMSLTDEHFQALVHHVEKVATQVKEYQQIWSKRAEEAEERAQQLHLIPTEDHRLAETRWEMEDKAGVAQGLLRAAERRDYYEENALRWAAFEIMEEAKSKANGNLDEPGVKKAMADWNALAEEEPKVLAAYNQGRTEVKEAKRHLAEDDRTILNFRKRILSSSLKKEQPPLEVLFERYPSASLLQADEAAYIKELFKTTGEQAMESVLEGNQGSIHSLWTTRQVELHSLQRDARRNLGRNEQIIKNLKKLDSVHRQARKLFESELERFAASLGGLKAAAKAYVQGDSIPWSSLTEFEQRAYHAFVHAAHAKEGEQKISEEKRVARRVGQLTPPAYEAMKRWQEAEVSGEEAEQVYIDFFGEREVPEIEKAIEAWNNAAHVKRGLLTSSPLLEQRLLHGEIAWAEAEEATWKYCRVWNSVALPKEKEAIRRAEQEALVRSQEAACCWERCVQLKRSSLQAYSEKRSLKNEQLKNHLLSEISWGEARKASMLASASQAEALLSSDSEQKPFWEKAIALQQEAINAYEYFLKVVPYYALNSLVPSEQKMLFRIKKAKDKKAHSQKNIRWYEAQKLEALADAARDKAQGIDPSLEKEYEAVWNSVLELRKKELQAWREVVAFCERPYEAIPERFQKGWIKDLKAAKNNRAIAERQIIWCEAQKLKALAKAARNQAQAITSSSQEEHQAAWDRVLELRKKEFQVWKEVVVFCEKPYESIPERFQKNWTENLEIAKNAKAGTEREILWNEAQKLEALANAARDDAQTITSSSQEEYKAVWNNVLELRKKELQAWREVVAFCERPYEAIPERFQDGWVKDLEIAKNNKVCVVREIIWNAAQKLGALADAAHNDAQTIELSSLEERKAALDRALQLRREALKQWDKVVAFYEKPYEPIPERFQAIWAKNLEAVKDSKAIAEEEIIWHEARKLEALADAACNDAHSITSPLQKEHKAGWNRALKLRKKELQAWRNVIAFCENSHELIPERFQASWAKNFETAKNNKAITEREIICYEAEKLAALVKVAYDLAEALTSSSQGEHEEAWHKLLQLRREELQKCEEVINFCEKPYEAIPERFQASWAKILVVAKNMRVLAEKELTTAKEKWHQLQKEKIGRLLAKVEQQSEGARTAYQEVLSSIDPTQKEESWNRAILLAQGVDHLWKEILEVDQAAATAVSENFKTYWEDAHQEHQTRSHSWNEVVSQWERERENQRRAEADAITSEVDEQELSEVITSQEEEGHEKENH